jgi:hypothetical protein
MAHVTIDNPTPRVVYTVGGTPTTGPFAIPFEFFDLADVRVFIGGVQATFNPTPTLNTEFSIAGTAVDGGFEGGSIAIGAAISNTAVIIDRVVPPTRSTDFPYPSPTLNIRELNTQLDKLFALAGQFILSAARALRLADSDDTAQIVLPDKNTRKNRYFLFNVDGDPGVADPPVVTTATLIVVQGTQPPAQTGLLWIDTGTVGQLKFKWCDGVDFIEIFNITIATNAVGSPAFAVKAAANIFTEQQTISRSGTLSLDLESSAASANSGPIFKMRRLKNGAVADELGEIRWEARNAIGTLVNIAAIVAIWMDPTNASEDTELRFRTNVAGAGISTKARVGAGFIVGDALQADPGFGFVAAQNGYRRGTRDARDLTDLAIDAVPDPTADYFLTQDASADAPKRVLLRDGGVTAIDRTGAALTIVNTIAETSLYSVIVKAGALGPNGGVRVTIFGAYQNNSGVAATFTLRVKFGGATRYEDVSVSLATSAVVRPFRLVLVLMNANATNSQNLNGELRIGNIAAAVIGLGDLATAPTGDAAFAARAIPVDTTLQQTLEVTIQHSAANANLSITRDGAVAELI